MKKYSMGRCWLWPLPLSAGPGWRKQRRETACGKACGDKASAEKAPDFSGVWEAHEPPSARKWAGYSFTGEIPEMTPWGKEQYEKTKPSWGPRAVEDSTDLVNPTTGNEVGCFPTGVPRIYVHPFPFEIVQIPGRVIELFEFNHFVRQIYTNGSHEHAKDLDPTWMGDSVGWWEGDTLVIDSVGFNDKTWLDRAGLPHSDQLHVIEHITPPKHDTLIVHITIDDPKLTRKRGRASAFSSWSRTGSSWR